MKLGLVLECDTGGPDELVLSCIARRLAPGIEVQAVGLGSKEQVFLKGEETARELVESSRCDLVLIVWDLKPFWEPAAEKNCKAETREMLNSLANLPAATRRKIRLLCLTWEIETWLIADERAVSEHLSTRAHKVRFRCKNPLSKTDPKAVLDRECKRYRGNTQRYLAVREAIQIAQCMHDTHRVRRIPSFTRFADLVCTNPRADFQLCGDVCNDLAYRAQQVGRA